MKNGGGKAAGGKWLTVRVPGALLPRLDQAAKGRGTDRAGFIRRAIREKLARHNASPGHPGCP
ncbi:MAG TPA: CopG family transcriptional regulator [Dongiaceae bacterium]|jgi:metal-responsive CopG/Arc/MetJ family transcriptional regulator|nr:CopG family transcriptional regulator [Dongiaceae bacterium]